MNTAVSSTAMAEARAQAYSMPLAEIDMSNEELFQKDTIWPYFERLRKEAPVHYQANGKHGAFWSVTKYKDIMAVDTNHKVFSSAPTWVASPSSRRAGDAPADVHLDGPAQARPAAPRGQSDRGANQPRGARGALIRTRACAILDSLPRDETFNWVEKVSIELTIQMLATLFDFPFEDRHLLTHWSDVATTIPSPAEDRDLGAARCHSDGMSDLFHPAVERARQRTARNDLVSMLAHAPATRNMDPREFLGTLGLLIVGGNDTTRNSISGGVWFLNQNPGRVSKAARQPRPDPERGVRDHPLPITDFAHAAHRGRRLRTRRAEDQDRRQSRDVVHFRQSRQRGDPGRGSLHRRPGQSAPASRLRLRRTSLRRQSAGGNAAHDLVGGGAEALPYDRGDGRPRAGAIGLHPWHRTCRWKIRTHAERCRPRRASLGHRHASWNDLCAVNRRYQPSLDRKYQRRRHRHRRARFRRNLRPFAGWIK